MYPGQQQTNPPNYMMLQHQYGGGAPPPPYYTPQPYYQQQHYASQRSGTNCCLRCICCIYCFIFIFIFSLALSIILTYTLYKPKIPIYTVQGFNVTSFNMLQDNTIDAEFLVTIRAENPNTRIGFIFGQDSSITVSFEGTILCTGKLPAFQQGHENVTMLDVPLAGKPVFGPDIQEAITEDQRQGRIPLTAQVIVPVTVVMDDIPMRQFEFHVSCHMTLDNLLPDKKPNILSATYTVGFGF